MKHLTDYINEQLNIEEINESNEKWYRFTTKNYTDQSIIDNTCLGIFATVSN